MAHVPRAILAKNFCVSSRALERMPSEELFIFQSDVPGSLEEDQRMAAGSLGISPQDFAFRASQPAIEKSNRWGNVRIVDSSTFTVSNTVASARVTVKLGGMREFHWHPNADEWQYPYFGTGEDDCIHERRTCSHNGLPRGRRRLCAEAPAVLRRKHGGHRF